MIALETVLNIEAWIVIFQELLVRNEELSHRVFNFGLPQTYRTAINVITAVTKDLSSKIIEEYRTDIINPLDFLFLKVQDLDQQSKNLRRKV